MSLLVEALRAPVKKGSRAVLTWQGFHFMSRQRGKTFASSEVRDFRFLPSLKPQDTNNVLFWQVKAL